MEQSIWSCPRHQTPDSTLLRSTGSPAGAAQIVVAQRTWHVAAWFGLVCRPSRSHDRCGGGGGGEDPGTAAAGNPGSLQQLGEHAAHPPTSGRGDVEAHRAATRPATQRRCNVRARRAIEQSRQGAQLLEVLADIHYRSRRSRVVVCPLPHYPDCFCTAPVRRASYVPSSAVLIRSAAEVGLSS